MLHKEMDVRLPAHISGKPLLQIIFDNQSMNIGSWEARQLSFLFDILDGKFVAFSVYHGFPHFRSLTHYIFTLILMLYFWSFLVYTLKIDRLVSLLLISLLLTTPSFIYTYYYRTSKIGISLLLIIILGEMYKVIKGKNYLQSGSLKPYQLFIIFLLATLGLMLFDVLGGFFATFIIIYMLIAYLYKPDKNKAAALGGMTMGYMIWVLYFLYLGPFLMYSITGQQANRSYLYGAPFQYFFGFILLGIPLLILDVVRLMFGYITETGGTILLLNLVAISIWLVKGSMRKSSKYLNFDTIQNDSKPYLKHFLSNIRLFIWRYEPLLSILFMLAGLAIIYTLLVTRHPPILWPDVRPTYYIMPAHVVLLFGISTLLARSRIKMILRRPVSYYFFAGILIYFLLGNMHGSIQIKRVLFNGKNIELFPHSSALLDALGRLNNPGYEADPSIETDPIYILFHKKH